MKTAAIERAQGLGKENMTTTEEKLTLAMVREHGISGADIEYDQFKDLDEEMAEKLRTSFAMVKDLRALKDKHIRQNNATGKSPNVAKFRCLRPYSGRDVIEHAHRYDRTQKEKLLALWDERSLSEYEDEYTRLLDKLIKEADDVYDDDLHLFNITSDAFWKETARQAQAKAEAKKRKRGE